MNFSLVLKVIKFGSFRVFSRWFQSVKSWRQDNGLLQNWCELWPRSHVCHLRAFWNAISDLSSLFQKLCLKTFIWTLLLYYLAWREWEWEHFISRLNSRAILSVVSFGTLPENGRLPIVCFLFKYETKVRVKNADPYRKWWLASEPFPHKTNLQSLFYD